jgi:hypothetical protein
LKDFLENEITVGDTIVYAPFGANILRKGTVQKITKCFVFVGKSLEGYLTSVSPAKVVVIK